MNKPKTDRSIKTWPKLERPRELLLEKGPEYLSDASLIAILLRAGFKGKDAVSLSRDLLQKFKGLRRLFAASKADLQNVKGLGPAKIAQIMAVVEIGKRYLKEKIIGSKYIENDRDLIEYLYLSVRDCKEEFFKIVYLSNYKIILGIDTFSKGTVDKVTVYPREVVKRALEIGSSAVIFVHNHPSGSPEPSQMDIDVTKRLISACLAVEIIPLDHIIISPNGHVRLRDEKLFSHIIKR